MPQAKHQVGDTLNVALSDISREPAKFLYHENCIFELQDFRYSWRVAEYQCIDNTPIEIRRMAY